MGLFSDKESENFARRLASELRTRVPPSLAATELERALGHVASRGKEYRQDHKVTILKQIGLSRTFQNELSSQGYDDAFIREVTLALARAMREKAS